MRLDKFVLPEELLKERPPRAQDRKVDAETADELIRLTGYGKPEIDESAKGAYSTTVLGHSQFPIMASTGEDTRRRLLGVGLHGNAKAYVDGQDVKHQTPAEREKGAQERAEVASTQLAQLIVSTFRADEGFLETAIKKMKWGGPGAHLKHTIDVPYGEITFMGGLNDDINKFVSVGVSDDVDFRDGGALHLAKKDGRQAWLKKVFLLTHAKVKAALLEQLRITGKFKEIVTEDFDRRGTWEDVKDERGEDVGLPWEKEMHPGSEASPQGAYFSPRSIKLAFKRDWREDESRHGGLQCELDVFFCHQLFQLYGDIKTVEWASLNPDELAKSFVVPQTVTEGRPARRTDIGVDKKTYEALRDASKTMTSISIETRRGISKELYPHRGYEKAFLEGSAMVLPDAELNVSGRKRMEDVSDAITADVREMLKRNTRMDVQDAVKACLFGELRLCDVFVEGPGREDPRSRWPYKMLGQVKTKLGSLGKGMDVKALLNTWL